MNTQIPDTPAESQTDPQPTHFSEALNGILERGEAKVLAAHLGVRDSFVSKIRNGGTGPIAPPLCLNIIAFFGDSPEKQAILARARMRDCVPPETYERFFYPEATRLREEDGSDTSSIVEKLDRLAVIAASNPGTRDLLAFLLDQAEREAAARA